MDGQRAGERGGWRSYTAGERAQLLPPGEGAAGAGIWEPGAVVHGDHGAGAGGEGGGGVGCAGRGGAWTDGLCGEGARPVASAGGGSAAWSELAVGRAVAVAQ